MGKPAFCISENKSTDPHRGRLLVSCVPIREQKNDEKGYFVLSSFRVGKCCLCGKRGIVFTSCT